MANYPKFHKNISVSANVNRKEYNRQYYAKVRRRKLGITSHKRGPKKK